MAQLQNRGETMGAEPYEYFVPYQANVQTALEQLRADVFSRGEFSGAELGPATPEEAFEMMDADGTASILDITHVATEPDFCCAAPFSPEELRDYFGTEKPTRAEVEQSDDYWESLERGQARYAVVYENKQPAELYFAGYSFD
jgi:hypothetical protein